LVSDRLRESEKISINLDVSLERFGKSKKHFGSKRKSISENNVVESSLHGMKFNHGRLEYMDGPMQESGQHSLE